MIARITKRGEGGGSEIARNGGGVGDVVSIMNNALLKMKTLPRFLDYNPTGNSDKSLRSGGKEGFAIYLPGAAEG